ncbi:2-dehydro-3-deoxygalactonokinase [Alphaproteobacteria bacterium KMM 3653]|uniref:2-dehydro-3-deoxygalactonokinase n=1 Tax=Harenicola maris TaxID=2841044 RepID=A0AAP2GAF6_9RHOB|nr:2-dehydro-3-deoxygalactonokinase [Harenicola maris]
MDIQWVALDWGTTNLNAYAIGADGRITGQLHNNMGMSQLVSSEFEPVLVEAIGPWLSADRVMPVLACGMVGAHEGWRDAGYSDAPCLPVDRKTTVSVPTDDPRLSVRIVPGVCQRQPEDVMRGEETQIAGYLARNPNFDGVFCLPGTHSKWARVADGKIQNFTTFMTGELFGLLTKQSVLRFSTTSHDWDDGAFLGGVKAAMSDPDRLTAQLFAARPRTLLSGTPNEVLKAHLSGLLIGAEIAALREMWRAGDIVIIGDRENARLYQTALATLDISPQVYDSARAIIDGLRPLAQVSAQTPEPV